MVISRLGPISGADGPLEPRELPVPEPGPGEVRVAISVCGVCHTELDEIEGRTPPPSLPVVPGHQVVGRVDSLGAGVSRPGLDERVGIGWIHHSDGSEQENLSAAFRATGRDVDGGYAEFMVVPAAYAQPIPGSLTDEQAAPLLCAGAVGYRALRLSGIGNGQTLGLTGFGGSGHLVLQMARHLFPDTRVFVFARDGQARRLAGRLGASWAGPTEEPPPEPLDAIIDTTPVWRPVVEALSHLRPGGRLVINAIRKEDDDKAALAELSYAEHLWMEKELKTVANVTRRDIVECLRLAAAIPIEPTVELYRLAEANRALRELKRGPVQGSKVLKVR